MRIWIVLLLFAAPCFAHERTSDECREAADMVMHFAQARDAKALDKATALQQFDDAVQAVSGFPPEQRWFIEDDEDVALLRGAVVQVFDNPDQPPEALGTLFRSVCQSWKAKHSDLLPGLGAPLKVASSQKIVPQAALESKTIDCYQRGIAAKHMAIVILAGLSKNEFWHRHQLDDTVAPEVRQELHDYIDRAYDNVEKNKSPRAFQKAEFDRCMDGAQ